ncbi:hypothetical protein [Bradyrhizobium zhanjiangense]|uniref:hypothetical protein n=1 Tax=Bradyrhizobium zhanjiangense TaxID=1325107 RepID=UPI001008EE40|nr:hypothetical protein [Bradyrhizobium zhanjiangense]
MTAGDRVCVLATEGALIGIAICLDFGDVCETPFSELDLATAGVLTLHHRFTDRLTSMLLVH